MKNWLLVGLGLFVTLSAIAQEAPGGPGAAGTWQRPDKLAYGTTANRPVWFTIAEGVVGEITFPRVDLVQTRDTFLMVRQGNKFLDERNLKNRVRRGKETLAFTVESAGQGIRIHKSVAAVPDSDAVIIDYTVELGGKGERELILVHNPLASGTAGGDTIEAVNAGQKGPSLLAYQGDVRGDEPEAMHVRARQLVSWTMPNSAATMGFEGSSAPENQMAAGVWPKTFSKAGPGNVAGALYTKVNSNEVQFRVVLQFFESSMNIRDVKEDLNDLLQVNLQNVISSQRQGWRNYLRKLDYDQRDQNMESSILVLKALEDKVERGAYIAGSGNPALPWAIYAPEMDYERSRRRIGDSNFGYRRVWPRDLYHKAMAFLAVGDNASALQIARWFKKTQFADGWWSQNMFVDGKPSWQAYQQDETGLPVVLVAHLVEKKIADYVEFRNMVRHALNFVMSRGPGTEQERWEENGGLSPNSLAAAVQGFWGGYWLEANFGDQALGSRYRDVAKEWTKGLKTWALIPEGRFGSKYFARIETGHGGKWDPGNHSNVEIKNKNNSQKVWFREDEILDLGFIQWITSGLVPADDPDFTHTLNLCDRNLMGNGPFGKGYFRYNEDAYGQDHRGGQWPLLSGERILAAIEMGQSYGPHMEFIEGMFTESGMLGEQDTLAIRPLGWSHANYLIVRRSIADRKSFYRFTARSPSQQR